MATKTDLSTVLLAFAQPIVDPTEPELTRESFRQRMDIAVTVWNAVTIEQWGKGEGFVTDARIAIAAMGSQKAMTMFEGLVKRKRELYGDDLRAIAKFSVVKAGDAGFKIRAKARKHN